MQLQESTDQTRISLAYLPPTPRQTLSAVAWSIILLVGLAALAPFSATPLLPVSGFIPAIDATIAITDLITVSLLLAHFSTTRSRALLALACGYLFSAVIVIAHGLSFPGVVSQAGNFGGSNQTTVRLYLFWHVGLPAAVFAYIWLKDKDRAPAVEHLPTTPTSILSLLGVLVLASGTIWLAGVESSNLPWTIVAAGQNDPLTVWLVIPTMLICTAALAVLLAFKRSTLDLWLIVVVLASIVELAISALFGGPRYSLGFYTGRLFSLVTSTLILAVLLAETSRLYARLARANMLASVAEASQALSSEIVLPRLIERLMTIALRNSGADRCLLVLADQSGYRIEAEAMMDGQRIVLRHGDAAVPDSIIRSVMNTQESVLINDTARPHLFSDDPYLAHQRPRSILCLPLERQGAPTGLVYLENTVSTHVFTPDRAKLLELLASQAAISLENTRLYADLQEREARVRRLINANIIGIFTWNRDGRIIDGNEAFLRIVGYQSDDLASGGMRWKDLMPSEWDPTKDRVMEELLATGVAPPFEGEYVKKDGSRVPVLIGAALFDGTSSEGVAFVVNMTDQKHAEELVREGERQYHQIQIELAHANRVATMGHLSASIAHELNQPLQGVVTNAQTALRLLGQDEPKVADALKAITRVVRDGTRAGTVINRIRTLSKKAPPEKEEIAINEVVGEIVGLTHGEVVKSGVTVQTELCEELPLVEGDRVQLQQVVLNLIMNGLDAIRGTDAGPREILISTVKSDSGELRVSVQDSGGGIDAEHVERIFDAFYTTKAEGLGMGLSICRSIIDAHGGRLWATTGELRGAAFHFTLPVGGGSPALDSAVA